VRQLASVRSGSPTLFKQCPLTLLLWPNPRTFCPFGNSYLIGWDFIDILPLRKFILDWLGFYSFVLRLGKEERQMLTPKALASHENNQQEFRTTYTTPSYHHLQQDDYLALERLLCKSIMVSNLFNQVTTVTSSCATNIWDLLLKAFPPSAPQVVAGLIAQAAVDIMRGPDHATADATKAFKPQLGYSCIQSPPPR
jgi:hypothetical protein